MGLRTIFIKGVETIFNVFDDAVKQGIYSVVFDDGFGTESTTNDMVRCIFETFTEEDVNTLSFAGLIQPQDIKGLIPFVDIVNSPMTAQGKVMFESDVYSIEGYELDPMSVIFTLLLRKV